MPFWVYIVYALPFVLWIIPWAFAAMFIDLLIRAQLVGKVFLRSFVSAQFPMAIQA